MTAEIIDGHNIAKKIEQKSKQKVEKLKQKGSTPKLGVVYIGEDKPSRTYINKKRQKAQQLGIEFELFKYPNDISRSEINNQLKKIPQGGLDGLIIQLPVPDRLYPDILDLVRPEIDVDCLTSENLGQLVKGTENFVPPTAGAIMEIIDKTTDSLIGKEVTIVGTGILVGKPTAIMLMNKEATVTTCNKHTNNLKEKCLGADILISGVGKKHLVTEDMVSENATVIDAGIDYKDGKSYGDIKKTNLKEKAEFITPTPGGVGPITVSKLLENVVKSATL
ncbi:MAG: bifunctional 5,10-methylenetetrahydrofolate dehydrogenase/5,10-methenyltetrahydrofolate cyclohydrolase [Candidatus Paceibacteria bacterium]